LPFDAVVQYYSTAYWHLPFLFHKILERTSFSIGFKGASSGLIPQIYEIYNTYENQERKKAASSVGALHINPFRSNGGAGLARAPWSRQQATSASAKHVRIALSLALGVKAGDQDHHMVVALAMKKDGLVLPGSRQEGRPAHAPVQSAAVATDQCCVALENRSS